MNCLLLSMGLTLLVQPAAPVPTRTWFGTIGNLELRGRAPGHRLILDREAFARLWQAWKPADVVPEIDFAQHVILVETHGSRKIDRFRLALGKDGNLKVAVEFSHHRDFPGFTFGMALVSRQGIHAIGGVGIKSP